MGRGLKGCTSSVNLSVSLSFRNILCQRYNFTYALMDYHLTWYKYCPHWDNVQWPWPGSIPQRLRSHKTFNSQSTYACVRAITYVCIDGLPSNLVQILSSLRRCAVTLTQIHTSNVKVTHCKTLQIKDSLFGQNNLCIDLTYSTHNLNNFNKYPFIICSYIQEYLGYRSNNFFPILDQW